MKRWLPPLFSVVMFALLAYYVVGIDRSNPAAVDDRQPVLRFQASAADLLRIRRPEGDLVIQRRPASGFDWWLQPQGVPASDSRLDYLLHNLADLRGVPIEKGTADLKAFGLNKPLLRVEICQGDKELALLLVGEKTPVTPAGSEAAYYVRTGQQPGIFMVDGSVIEQLRGRSEDWRERYLAELPPGDVVSVSVADHAQRVAATKEQGRWVMTSPRRSQIGAAAVETLINRVAFLEAREFISDDPAPAELVAFGLDKPWLRVELTTAKDLRREILVGGKVGPGDMYYARLAGRPWVFLVEAARVEELRAAAQEIRR